MNANICLLPRSQVLPLLLPVLVANFLLINGAFTTNQN